MLGECPCPIVPQCSSAETNDWVTSSLRSLLVMNFSHILVSWGELCGNVGETVSVLLLFCSVFS